MFKDVCCGYPAAEMVVSATGVVGNNYPEVSTVPTSGQFGTGAEVESLPNRYSAQ